MFDLKKFSLWNDDFFNFEDQEISKNYHNWHLHVKQKQVTVVTAISAVLYLFYYQINKNIIPPELMSYTIIIQLCLLPLALFAISYLSAKKIYHNFTTALLMLTPMGATLGNMFIVSKLEISHTYLTEIYLMIIWIFIVSGLRFLHATLSALGVFVLSLSMTYFVYPLEQDIFIMHLFWTYLFFAFGFYGAYLLEKSAKDTFLAYEELVVFSTTQNIDVVQDKSHLVQLIEKEISRSKRYGNHFVLLFLDVDDFEETEKIHGNQIADLMLIEMGKLIKEQIRLSDTFVRWGGEAFVVVYQETDENVAKKLVEKLRYTIMQHTFSNVGKKTGSFGITAYKEHDDAQIMLKRAENALNKAKRNGKNLIEVL